MERSSICPSCLSHYPDIKGLLYSPGSYVGTQCEDYWHKGFDYDPNKLKLTAYDEEFLSEQHIGF